MCEDQLREIEPEHAEKVGSLNEMQAELASVRAQVNPSRVLLCCATCCSFLQFGGCSQLSFSVGLTIL